MSNETREGGELGRVDQAQIPPERFGAPHFEGTVLYPPSGGLVVRVTVGGETVERTFTREQLAGATRLQWSTITVGRSSADPNARVTAVNLVAEGERASGSAWHCIWQIWPEEVES
jgi:hypothetical protein